MNKIPLIVALGIFIALTISINGVACADYYVCQVSNPVLADFTSTGTGTVAEYSGAGAYGGSGSALSIYSTNVDKYITYDVMDTDFIATNQCYVSVWFKTATSSGKTYGFYVYYNDVLVASQTGTTAGSSISATIGGWVDIVAGAKIKARIVHSAGSTHYDYIDEFVCLFSATPIDTDTFIQLYDEETNTDLASFSPVVKIVPYESSTFANEDCYAKQDYFEVFTFTNNPFSIKISEGIAGNTWHRDNYLTVGETNYVVIPTITPVEYLVSVIDTTDTYGVNTHFKAIKEIGGINITIDEQTLSWSKICYSWLMQSDYYVLTLTNPSNNTVIYGNVSVFDNPIYIILEIVSNEDSTINVSVASINQTQTVDFTISSNWTEPDLSGSMFVITMSSINSYEFGHILLSVIPFVVLSVGFKKRMYLYSAIAIGCCFLINLAVGVEIYSQSILGIALTFNIFLIYAEGEAKE